MKYTIPRIAIAWNGLPFYAARLIRAGIEQIGEPVIVIGTKPSVPIIGMEEALGQKILWINADTSCSWSDFDLLPPQLFMQTGWAYRAFNDLGNQVRHENGRVIAMVDNCWKNSLRQWVGALVFRAYYRSWFDAVLVPGKSGRRLMRFLGMPGDKIYEGMYGSDPEVFSPGPCLADRNKTLIFVGQLIQRKGINLLVEAFKRLHYVDNEWTLTIVGSGPLKGTLQDIPGVNVIDFKQPSEVAHLMRQARFLVLPSFEEHWGLVVHEAALSGCAIIASDAVAAHEDLVDNRNGIVFKSGSLTSLFEALTVAVKWDSKKLQTAQLASFERAACFGPDRWAETFVELVRIT